MKKFENALCAAALLLTLGACSRNTQVKVPSAEEKIVNFVIHAEAAEITAQLKARLPVSVVLEEAVDESQGPRLERFFLAGLNKDYAGRWIQAHLLKLTAQGQLISLGKQSFSASYAFFKNGPDQAVLKNVQYPAFKVNSSGRELHTLIETQITQHLTTEQRDFNTKLYQDQADLKLALNEITSYAQKAERLLCPLDQNRQCQLRRF